jgi:3-hydroxybutyryl-CoA dehydrogenase
MNIYVIGNSFQFNEIKDKVAKEHSVKGIQSVDQISGNEPATIFDFGFDETTDSLEQYAELSHTNLFINATGLSLVETAYFSEIEQPSLFGMAADPTFLERSIMEISAHPSNAQDANRLIELLGIKATIVEDRVGMVTPRIIAMIINEAYFTVQEGTATREDIDTGMKLGTNYPMGPFEWASKWGIVNIYELLEALYLDTKEERYKICPLLKKEYLLS